MEFDRIVTVVRAIIPVWKLKCNPLHFLLLQVLSWK